MGHYWSEMQDFSGEDSAVSNKPLPKKVRFDKRRMWRTARGEVLRPKEFQDDHLLNTIRLLDRRYSEDQTFFWHDPIFAGMDPPAKQDVWPIYGVLIREAKRRGLSLRPVYDAGSRKQNRQGRLASRGPIVVPFGPKWNRSYEFGFDGITIVMKEEDVKHLSASLKLFLRDD